jgi:hypothetical protein
MVVLANCLGMQVMPVMAAADSAITFGAVKWKVTKPYSCQAVTMTGVFAYGA